jgi:prepilin-type N-terminal cleavage/methylation domain-containing protein
MRSRLLSSESGFTLLELLAVVVIIGILSAIALAMFTAQKQKGQDADAKSNASALTAAVDRCYLEASDFRDCDGQGAADQLSKTGLPMGTGAGQVSVTSSTLVSFRVTALSTAGHHFFVDQGAAGVQVRSCDAGASTDGGGCVSGSW